MNIKQALALTALTLAGGAVLADEAPGAPLTRAEVRQSVLDARASHTLAHPGEAGPEEKTPYQAQIAAPSTVTRGEEKAEVLQARRAGTLVPPSGWGPEDDMKAAQAHPSTSGLTRAEVKNDVLQARANGTLIPAGQGEFTGDTPAQLPHVFAHLGRTGNGVAATRGE